ncbi:enoyl-CoA hydratase/isomerase family protein [Falsigemmobacter faecalis]|uniref:Enoyl-CoA hydratase n=1 Tax=Falsigemmobacter faecalis TaxID=2488730 RepID=A0A3P3DV71_9RHOB|nr:enoyl-CoA hydratase-related protein [Falsigemmobacter faecalis]RRH78187.1 enoyl-CoA hydratase [Falsigemmobacter faecalis]
MTSLIDLSYGAGFAHLRFNCPERMNVLSPAMAEAFNTAVTTVLARADLGVLLLSGAGRNFMAGGDLNGFAGAEDKPAFIAQTIDLMHDALQRLGASDLIVIAAVHGPTAGAGVSLVAMSDLVIAAEGAIFTMAYTRIAGGPDCGATWALPRAVGLKRATAMVLLNAPMPAEEALQVGLINRIVPAEDLSAVSLALAKTLAEGPRAAQGSAKRLLRQAMESDLQAALAAERAAFVALAGHEDFSEGVTAFLQRRKPDFKRQVAL